MGQHSRFLSSMRGGSETFDGSINLLERFIGMRERNKEMEACGMRADVIFAHPGDLFLCNKKFGFVLI